MLKVPSFILSLGFMYGAYADVAPIGELSCYILEAPSQGQPAIEATTLSQPLEVLPAGSFSPGGLFAEIKYTTKDGLFKIDAEAVKPVKNQVSSPGLVTDYLPIWITNVETGAVIAASGNPHPELAGMPNNDSTDLHGEFPTSINVTCGSN